MARVQLNYTKEFNSLNAYYFEEFIGRYFDLRPYDQKEKNQNILLGLPYGEAINKIKPHLESCCSIIVDNLLECRIPADLDHLKPYKDKVLMLTAGNHTSHPWLNLVPVPNWFWYFESPWYRARNYHSYSPNTCEHAKLFLMPIRRTKPGRDLIYAKLNDLLHNDSIFSYVERGVFLPGVPEEHKDDQRWFDPTWYDNTLFSVVNEDSIDHDPKIYTEKTCKPLAFYHPFILVAQQGILQMVKNAGFETFPELFDESYDILPRLEDRINHIDKQIRSFDRSLARSPDVLKKLQFNHDRFFDLDIVYRQIKKEVVDPIMDFVTRS